MFFRTERRTFCRIPRSFSLFSWRRWGSCVRPPHNNFREYRLGLPFLYLIYIFICSFTFHCKLHPIDGNNLEPWAVGLSSNNFRLLCRDGGLRPVQEYQTCNLGKVPAPKVRYSKAGIPLWLFLFPWIRSIKLFFIYFFLFCGCLGNDWWLEICRTKWGYPGCHVEIVWPF